MLRNCAAKSRKILKYTHKGTKQCRCHLMMIAIVGYLWWKKPKEDI